jgi:tetratricopeptide (TPR) repeat protein
MKKGFFIIIMILLLQGIAGSAFADTEYDAALKEYYSGHYKDAVIRLKAYVEKKPDAVAYYLIGYSLYKLHRFPESAEYFKQAYLIDPNFSPEKLDLGENLHAFKAKASRKKAPGHARAHKRHAPQEKPKTPDKKAASSPAAKTGKKSPGKK